MHTTSRACIPAASQPETEKTAQRCLFTVLQLTLYKMFFCRHTSRFLLCWLTILPFCTAGQVGWLTVPIACAMAFFLLGIEVSYPCADD